MNEQEPVRIKVSAVCPRCDGTGSVSRGEYGWFDVPCKRCKGKGKKPRTLLLDADAMAALAEALSAYSCRIVPRLGELVAFQWQGATITGTLEDIHGDAAGVWCRVDVDGVGYHPPYDAVRPASAPVGVREREGA